MQRFGRCLSLRQRLQKRKCIAVRNLSGWHMRRCSIMQGKLTMGRNESAAPYTTPDGAVRFQAIIGNETLWLNQLGMAELFEVEVS